MRDTRSQGTEFEDMAVKYLEDKGYNIIGRNVHILRKELDIIALDGETVVFVEVKGRTSDCFGKPSEAVTRRKISGILKAASAYLEQANLWERPARFDVISISKDQSGNLVVEHIENAFPFELD